MKTYIRTILLLLVFGISAKAMAQGTTLTIFSEKNENFTVFVNGDQKNTKPGDHVVIQGLYGPSFKLRVVFQDVSIREISKTVFNSTSGELYYVVKPGKKGDYIFEKTSSDYVHTGEAAKAASATTAAVKEEKQAAAKTEPAAKKSGSGCSNPMPEGDFQASTVAISNAPFDGIKLSQAKKVVDAHCLYCRQIVELMYIMSSESSRLSLAKEAYHHCYDPENYGDVKDALNSIRSKDDLERYISSAK
ncbi:MAG: DUF4476 domain-containing protein [Bacteroidetes bacterium]|nr:DUF4476 domain-containing protein [Bacteroidota bacterium]